MAATSLSRCIRAKLVLSQLEPASLAAAIHGTTVSQHSSPPESPFFSTLATEHTRLPG
jgi:hypothetical protein